MKSYKRSNISGRKPAGLSLLRKSLHAVGKIEMLKFGVKSINKI